MSEEINEDNCVLNSNKLETIEKSLNHYLAKIFPRDMKFAKEHSLSLFLKIKKLNDLETLAKAVMEYCNEEVGRSEGVGIFYGDDWKNIVEYCFLPALKEEKR